MKERPNFHRIHKERNMLRREGREVGIPEETIKAHEPHAHHDFRIADYGSLTNAKEALRRDRERPDQDDYVIDWNAINESLGETDARLLAEVEKRSESLENGIQARSIKLREMSGNPKKTELYKALVRMFTADIDTKRDELTKLASEHPDMFRIKDLLAYREGLFEDGHIAEVPSVKRYLARIEEAMIEGKPMFLHGPTGTGKTSLAIRTAEKLTAKDPEIIYCNPQTKESNIFGKTGIGIDETTEKQVTQFDYGPLVRAMREGKVVIFDEFTALPKDMMVMLKGIMNAKVGDRRTIPGNGEVIITEGFQMIFTANLKSEKNQERQDIPPEMANEFAQNNIEVRYQSESESYDIMLARLLQPDGTIDMSPYDMEVTLPEFARAIAEIQRAYATKIEGDLGNTEGLKKLVFNQRTVENILSRWKTAKMKGEEGDFVTFLDRQLTIPLTFKEYSEKDRALATKILARHGLLTTVTPETLDLPSDTFVWNPKDGEETKAKSAQARHYALREVAELDPFHTRTTDTQEIVDALLQNSQAERNTPMSPESLTRLLKESGSTAELDPTFEGGIISVDIDPQTLKDLPTAFTAYKNADNRSPSWIWEEWEKMKTYTPPASPRFDAIILSYNNDPQTRKSSDAILADMDKAGLRPATIAELIALGIAHPECNKRTDTYLLGLGTKESLVGFLYVPDLDFYDSGRSLDGYGWAVEWGERCRFVCVRK